MLTDPCIHSKKSKKVNGKIHKRFGKTDKGIDGMNKFFKTH